MNRCGVFVLLQIAKGLLLVGSLAGCNKPAASTISQVSAVNSAAEVNAVADGAAECTLETPLIPGVPGSPGHLLPSDRNPNGDSELSTLMRRMQADLTTARDNILQGRKVAKMWSRYRKIRCAWPTEPADRNQQFDASARAYLDAIADLETAAPPRAIKAYDRVLNACRSCHEQSCSGALVAIEALRIAPLSTPH